MAILETKGLSRDFGGLRALDRLDFELHEGEIVGIVGPNGSGKTTLINLLTGFLKPSAGDILYGEHSIRGLKPYQLAERGIVRTFQLTTMFPNLTTMENIIAGSYLNAKGNFWGSFCYSKSYRQEEMRLRQRAGEILSFMGFEGKDNVIVTNLPSVDQRKLETAVALATEPKLLMLDEPAAGASPEEQDELIDMMQAIQRMGITLMIIEHNMRVIMRLCSRVVVLDYGRKIAEGTPQDIVTNDEVVAIYLGSRTDA